MRLLAPIILSVSLVQGQIAFAQAPQAPAPQPGVVSQEPLVASQEPLVASQEPASPPERVESFENRPIRSADSVLRANAPTTRAAVAPGSALDLQRVVLALFIVVGLIVLLRFAVRKFFPDSVAPSASRVVKVLGRTMLAPRQHVLLLQVGRRVLVVADNGGQLSSLAQITDADEVAQLMGAIASKSREEAASFQTALNQHAKHEDEEPSNVESMRQDVARLMETVRSIRVKNGAE